MYPFVTANALNPRRTKLALIKIQCPWKLPEARNFSFPIINNDNMADARTCQIGALFAVFPKSNNYVNQHLLFQWLTAPWGPRPPHCSRLHDHTLRHTTLGRMCLDEGPPRRRDLYLTTHNTHKRQTSMPSAGLEPTTPVSERPQTYALDGAATG
jgi:hypothetical protein